jgi:hypothetical protein
METLCRAMDCIQNGGRLLAQLGVRMMFQFIGEVLVATVAAVLIGGVIA